MLYFLQSFLGSRRWVDASRPDDCIINFGVYFVVDVGVKVPYSSSKALFAKVRPLTYCHCAGNLQRTTSQDRRPVLSITERALFPLIT